MSPRFSVWLAALALAATAANAVTAATPVLLQLPPAARVGVVNLLDPEVTHLHAARRLEERFLRTYAVSWSVSDMLLAAVGARLAQLGLTAVPVGAGEGLRRGREACFLDAALGRKLPRECLPLYADLAAAQRLDALIVLGPGRNDATHAGGERHRELPDYLRGWCVVTGEGSADTPLLLDLTELLLIATRPAGVQLVARAWGGELRQSWTGFRAPQDLHALPPPQLDELQPLFAAMLGQQAQTLLMHLQTAR